MINHEKLKIIEEAYWKSLPGRWRGESFKWRAIKHFQSNWDIEASDFAGMLEKALGKTDRLLASGYYYPRSMLIQFAQEDTEGLRAAFHVLYDESRDLAERIAHFQAYAEDRRANHNDRGWKNHFQDSKAISVYLWLRFPDKYYIYKFSDVLPAAKELESSFIPKRNSYPETIIDGYRFYDEIREQISKNEKIITTFKKLLTADHYADPQCCTLAFDVVFYITHYYLDDDNDLDENDAIFQNEGWMPSLEEYTPGITKEVWLKLLNSSDVIGPNWGGTLAAFYDAGGQATCTQIGQKFGKNPMSISAYCTSLAKRIHKKTGCPLSRRENGMPRYWPILFQGKAANEATPGSFIWKLRPELYEALGEFHIERYLWAKTEPDMANEAGEARQIQNVEPNAETSPYTAYEKYDSVKFLEDVFMSEEDFNQLIGLVRRKKNVILQGAPGVGKTYTAKRIAYVMMGMKDISRIASVQFHQNYSYEDFIMGYKPDGADFSLQTGIFYDFCEKARQDPTRDYFFIIDEINRGNMSKIFGELLQLVETDYRDEEALLIYNHQAFSVPRNMYLIGMMNTADRSLALIDYALRRRFSFFEMSPGFATEGFQNYSKQRVKDDTFNKLVEQLITLNKTIEGEPALGSGFLIGHSYLCLQKDEQYSEEWLHSVVRYDILPTLREYWFEDNKKYEEAANKLEGVFNG